MKTLVVAALAAVLTTGAFAAPDITYDPKAAQRDAIFEQMYLRTAECMRQGSVAMLRQGSRDSNQIRVFTIKACGPNLAQFLTSEVGMGHEDIADLLEIMSAASLKAAINGTGPLY